MEHPDYLPLGSVCSVKGSNKKLMVLGRGLLVHQDRGSKKLTYFDYGACLYPEGLVSDQVMYFNHDGIQEVFWEGYKTEEDAGYLAKIREYTEGIDIKRGVPAPVTLEDVKEAAGHGNA